MKTLNDGPTSDSDDSNESTHDFPPRTGIELVSADHTFLSDPINTSFSELKDADQTELTFYFAEPNDVERYFTKCSLVLIARVTYLFIRYLLF